MANQRLGTLVLDLRARLDNFKSDMEKASNLMKGEVASIGRSAAALQLPFAAIGGLAMKAAFDFDAASRTIRASTGATGERLKELQGIVREVYRGADESMQEVSAAVAQLSQRTGLAGPALKDLTELMLDFADVSGMDIPNAVRTSTRLFGDWAIATDKQRAAMDNLLRVAQTTGIDYGRMMETMTYYGAPLRQLGFTFEQAALLLGKFDKEGVNAEMVIAGLGRSLTKFYKEGISPAQGLADAIKKIKEASAVDASALGRELVGSRPGASENFVAAIREGRMDLDAMNRSLRENSDTVAAAADEAESFSKKAVKAWHEVEEALLPLGEALFKTFKTDMIPMLKDSASSISNFVREMNELPDGLTDVAVGIGGVTAALVVGAPLLGVWVEKTMELLGALGKIGALSAGGGIMAAGAATGIFAYLFGGKEMESRLSDYGIGVTAQVDKQLEEFKKYQDAVAEASKKSTTLAGVSLTLGKNLGQLGNESKIAADGLGKVGQEGAKNNLTLEQEIKLLEEATNKKLGYVEGMSEEAQWLKILNALHNEYANIPTVAGSITGIKENINLPDFKELDVNQSLENMGITPGVIKIAQEKIRTLQDVIADGWSDVSYTMNHAFAYGFSDIIRGATSLKDGLKNIWDSIKRSFTDMLGQMLSFFLGNFVKRLLGGSAGLLGTFGVSMGSAGTGGIASAAAGTGAASFGGGSLFSSLAGGLPLLGGGLGMSLGSSLLGGAFGGGTAGSIMGGIGGGLLGGITGISALGAAATGTGLGGMLGSMGFLFTNPITAILGGGLALGALANYLYKSPADRAAQETGRDFGGIKVSTKTFEEFAGGLGLNKSGYEGIRKDLLSSPKYLTEVAYPLAQQQGKVEEFLSSLANVQTAWGIFDFRSAFETWMKTGSASALNSAFEQAFAQSQALELNLPNWEESLDATGSSSSSDGRVKIRRPTSVGSVSAPAASSSSRDATVNITINLNALDGESAAQATRTKIIPEIVAALKTNVNNSRVNIVSALGV